MNDRGLQDIRSASGSPSHKWVTSYLELHISDRVSLNAPLSDQISQKLPERHPKCALLGVELHLVCLRRLNALSRCWRLSVCCTFFTNISSTYTWCSWSGPWRRVNHSLESGPNILESEGHHLVAVDFSISGESCLVFFWWVHLDLIISGIGVHETKELVVYRRLY